MKSNVKQQQKNSNILYDFLQNVCYQSAIQRWRSPAQPRPSSHGEQQQQQPLAATPANDAGRVSPGRLAQAAAATSAAAASAQLGRSEHPPQQTQQQSGQQRYLLPMSPPSVLFVSRDLAVTAVITAVTTAPAGCHLDEEKPTDNKKTPPPPAPSLPPSISLTTLLLLSRHTGRRRAQDGRSHRRGPSPKRRRQETNASTASIASTAGHSSSSSSRPRPHGMRSPKKFSCHVRLCTHR